MSPHQSQEKHGACKAEKGCRHDVTCIVVDQAAPLQVGCEQNAWAQEILEHGTWHTHAAADLQGRAHELVARGGHHERVQYPFKRNLQWLWSLRTFAVVCFAFRIAPGDGPNYPATAISYPLTAMHPDCAECPWTVL